MAAHAKLSASGSSRWLTCSGSIEASKGYPNSSNIYADMGSLAHQVGELCLRKNKDAEDYLGKDLKKHFPDGLLVPTTVPEDMIKPVQQYLDFARSFIRKNSTVMVEVRVNYSEYIGQPKSFGTADFICTNGDHVDIVDLKYGMGLVSAVENTQAQLYALGVLNELDWLEDFKTVTVHIAQPRTRPANFSSWDISVADLLKFAKYAKRRAKLALSKNAPRTASEKACEWCPARADCKTLHDHVTEVIGAMFDDMTTLSDDHKHKLILNKKLILNFIKAVETSVTESLLAGEDVSGFYLGVGRSTRRWSEEAEEYLQENYDPDEIYTQKLIGVTQGDKLLSRDEMQQHTMKPDGLPVLCLDGAKTKRYVLEDVSGDFEDVS